MTKQLEGKIALITGGTSGIGLATAKLFADEGARVIATGSSAERVEAARAVLGDRAEIIRSEASDTAEIDKLFAHIARTYDGIDILFLNAGVFGQAPLATLDERAFDDLFRINVKGPFFALRAAIPLLRRGGAVVLNGSISGSIGMPGTAVYSATKAALRSLGRVAAAELVERGVRVNVISPGPTETGILDKHGLAADVLASLKQGLTAQVPQRRFGSSDEVARAVVFLASDASSFVTGQELVVDGGMTGI